MNLQIMFKYHYQSTQPRDAAKLCKCSIYCNSDLIGHQLWGPACWLCNFGVMQYFAHLLLEIGGAAAAAMVPGHLLVLERQWTIFYPTIHIFEFWKLWYLVILFIMSLLAGTVGGTAELLRPRLMSVKMCNITLTNARWRWLGSPCPPDPWWLPPSLPSLRPSPPRLLLYSMSLEGF